MGERVAVVGGYIEFYFSVPEAKHFTSLPSRPEFDVVSVDTNCYSYITRKTYLFRYLLTERKVYSMVLKNIQLVVIDHLYKGRLMNRILRKVEHWERA